jgi:cytochrome c553
MWVKRLQKRRSVNFINASRRSQVRYTCTGERLIFCKECNMKRRLLILVGAFVLIASSAISVAAENATSKGKAKAEAQCNVCHGSNGMSQIPNAPHLAGQPEIYLTEQLKNYRSGKRANEVMGVLAKPLTDDDIANLAAWYASIEIKATPK